jgi:hypothetical protein
LETLGASAQEQDDAVSWLESLASKHGAKAEELVTDPSTRSEKPPEWVQQARTIAESQSQEAPEEESSDWLRRLESPAPAQEQFAPQPAAEDKETEDWLAGLAGAASQSSEWQPPADEHLADWSAPQSDELKSLFDEQPPVGREPDRFPLEQPQEPMFKETPLKETPASADLPDWLRGFERETEKPAAPDENLPSWLREEEHAAQVEPEPEPEPTMPSDWRPVEAIQPDEEEPALRPAPAPAQPKPARTAPKPAARQPKAETKSQPRESTLSQAQNELNRGDIPAAMEQYNKLIKKGRFLEETIRDLRDALYRYPVEVSIWQTLGDAYMRSNRLQEALDAYTKAEELLR